MAWSEACSASDRRASPASLRRVWPASAIEASGGGTEDYVFNTAEHAALGGAGAVLGGGKFANGAVTGAFGYLFNHMEQIINKRQYRLYLVAEHTDVLRGAWVGHVFIGGIDPSGKPEAWGFYPVGSAPMRQAESLSEPGALQDDRLSFGEALHGDHDFAMAEYDVTEGQYHAVMNYLHTYYGHNTYSITDNSCVDAAINALNYAGIRTDFSSIPSISAVHPNDIFERIKRGWK